MHLGLKKYFFKLIHNRFKKFTTSLKAAEILEIKAVPPLNCDADLFVI